MKNTEYMQEETEIADANGPEEANNHISEESGSSESAV